MSYVKWISVFSLRLRRLALMSAFHIARISLRPIEAIAPRAYMSAYSLLLSKLGVTFTGKPRYISSGAKFDDFRLISFGKRVVVSDRVIFLTHDFSLTTALISIDRTPNNDVAFHKGIRVGDNVFIGISTIVMPGAIIGNNAIIGAGSIVRGSIPEDSISIGNPARTIGKLSDKAYLWLNEIDQPHN